MEPWTAPQLCLRKNKSMLGLLCIGEEIGRIDEHLMQMTHLKYIIFPWISALPHPVQPSRDRFDTYSRHCDKGSFESIERFENGDLLGISMKVHVEQKGFRF